MVASGFYKNEKHIFLEALPPTTQRKTERTTCQTGDQTAQIDLPKAKNPPTQIERAKVRKLKDHLEDDVHSILMGQNNWEIQGW